MTRDEAREKLLAGKTLSNGPHYVTERWLNCWSEENCCHDSFESVEDALDFIFDGFIDSQAFDVID